MRTHPESIWIDRASVAEIRDGMRVTCTVEIIELYAQDSDVEFVPAAAYQELKAKLVEAWSDGYVAGQECSKDGAPRRNPFSVAEKESES